MVRDLQGTLGALYERQITSVFMHVRHHWFAFPINRTMSKHSIHNHKRKKTRSKRERDPCSREKNYPHREFTCDRNNESICESFPYKLRDKL